MYHCYFPTPGDPALHPGSLRGRLSQHSGAQHGSGGAARGDLATAGRGEEHGGDATGNMWGETRIWLMVNDYMGIYGYIWEYYEPHLEQHHF